MGNAEPADTKRSIRRADLRKSSGDLRILHEVTNGTISARAGKIRRSFHRITMGLLFAMTGASQRCSEIRDDDSPAIA
jgi:hypothetical protein